MGRYIRHIWTRSRSEEGRDATGGIVDHQHGITVAREKLNQRERERERERESAVHRGGAGAIFVPRDLQNYFLVNCECYFYSHL